MIYVRTLEDSRKSEHLEGAYKNVQYCFNTKRYLKWFQCGWRYIIFMIENIQYTPKHKKTRSS